jgi:hypothetical protein
MDGIRVIRVWSYKTANECFMNRILPYHSFMLSATLAAPFSHVVAMLVGASPQFLRRAMHIK